MNTGNQQEMKDKELVEYAAKLLEAYAASAQNRAAGATLEKGRPYALGAGGIIELTEDIISAQSGFVHRAAKLLKSKAAMKRQSRTSQRITAMNSSQARRKWRRPSLN
jgi:hypothetical protein